MKSHRMTSEYALAFNAFLNHTTEKQDLFKVLSRRIKALKAKSLLDIGAGNGDLAFPLSRIVDNYIAIEPNLDHAIALRTAGLTVSEVPFPWRVFSGAFFDVVLASHVVPWEKDDSEDFLDAAWKCLNPGGSFIMVTHDERNGDWNELLQKVGLSIPGVGQGHFERYKKSLQERGALEIEAITTYVEAEELGDMLFALSFVYSDGKREDGERFRANHGVRAALQSQYHSDGMYRFPFTHYFLQATKKS